MHQVDISPQTMTIDLLVSSINIPLATAGVLASRASAVTSARVPVVTGVRSATVTAVRAASTGLGGVPVATGTNAGLVAALKAGCTGSVYVPVVSGSATVQAVRATSTSVAPVPVTSQPVNVSVTALKSGSTSISSAPTITGEAVLTGGGPGTASWMALIPVVSLASPPQFGSISSLTPATTSPAAVPVPAGVAAGNVILVGLFMDTVGVSVTPPAGFAEAPDSPVSGVQHALRIFWKRTSGADSGTYDFTYAGGTWRSGFAMRFTGCVASGNPFDVTNSAVQDTSTLTTPVVVDTTTGSNRSWVWVSTGYNLGNCSTIGGFTEQLDIGSNGIVVDTRPEPSTASSGSLVGTWTISGTHAAWLGALLPT